jgi:hypothetical protein
MSAVGAYFGIRALSLGSDLRERCDPARCTDPAAVRIHDEAAVAARVANITIPLGVAAIGVGAYLWLSGRATDAAGKRDAVVVVPSGDAQSVALTALGRFE